MKTFKLHLLRHGLSEANLTGVYAGSGTDLPLCSRGEEELRRLAQDFSYPPTGLVFVSPLLRARQTAALLYPGVRQIGVEELREIHRMVETVKKDQGVVKMRIKIVEDMIRQAEEITKLEDKNTRLEDKNTKLEDEIRRLREELARRNGREDMG